LAERVSIDRVSTAWVSQLARKAEGRR